MDKTLIALPTYNNDKFLKDIIKRTLQVSSEVLVVNDGSTDETKKILKEFPEIQVLEHEKNLGKGMALKNAFSYAVKKGYSTVVTLDTDGQHFPEDLPKFFKKIDSKTLLVGKRIFPDSVPSSSSFGRKFSNFWVRLETGQKISDTQSGFRAYPVSKIPFQKLKKNHYDFEIEVLVRSAWEGVKFDEIPIQVHYGEDRITHFKPFKDNLRLSLLHSKLFLLSFFKKRKTERKGVSLIPLMFKLLPIPLVYILTPFIVFGYFLTGKAEVSAMIDFHRHLGIKNNFKLLYRSFLNFLYFSLIMVDRILYATKIKDIFYFYPRGAGYDVDPQKAAVFVGMHFGDWALNSEKFTKDLKRKVNVVIDLTNAKKFQELEKKNEVSFIDISQGIVPMFLQIKEAFEKKELVCFLGDRIDDKRHGLNIEFLGEKRTFPTYFLELAKKYGIPVYIFVGVRKKFFPKNSYQLVVDRIWDGLGSPEISELCARMVCQMEKIVRSYPYNWFNFYKFWYGL